MEGFGGSSGTPFGGKGNDHHDRDTLPVFYYEKLVSYMPSSFADLVFTGERIEVGLKRGKFDYVSPAHTNSIRSGSFNRVSSR